MMMHTGHRERLRDRFLTEGLNDFAPHEALEMLLFSTRPRGDVNPLAHRLLRTFGSLKGVLEAPMDQLLLEEGVGEETALLLSMMVPMFRRYEASLCEERMRLRAFEDIAAHCRALMVGESRECFGVICLSSQMRVQGQRIVSKGSLGEVPAYPRMVAEMALRLNAYGVVLCHNHPDGRAEPTYNDVQLTLQMRQMLADMEVELVDHIILANGEAYSMVHHGDLPPMALPFDYPQAMADQVWMEEGL